MTIIKIFKIKKEIEMDQFECPECKKLFDWLESAEKCADGHEIKRIKAIQESCTHNFSYSTVDWNDDGTYSTILKTCNECYLQDYKHFKDIDDSDQNLLKLIFEAI